MATIVADDKFRWTFFNENDENTIRISLKFVSRCPTDMPAFFSGIGLAPKRRLTTTPTNADLVHWRIYIYAAQRGVELNTVLAMNFTAI